MRALQFCVILFELFCISWAYNAKVFEYTPKLNENNAELTMLLNVQELSVKINRDDNVVVFPEYGLTTIEVLSKENLKKFGLEIPEINTNITYSDNKVLKELALLAFEKEIYLLANVIEVNATEYYNTNLVFDTTGKLIARYRKINLSDEEKRLLTAGTDVVEFDTNFGKFTTFTGADIMYKHPAFNAVGSQVSDVLYASAWTSKSPFWSSVSLQDGFAKRIGANVIASSYSFPSKGMGGSGIYHGTEGNNVQIQAIPGLTATTSKVERASIGRAGDCIETKSTDEMDSRILLDVAKSFVMKNALSEKPDLKHYGLPRTDTAFESELCSSNGQFCCKFNALLTNPINDQDLYYKFIMYSKNNNYACGLVSCQSDNIQTCGTPIFSSKNNRFAKVKVEAEHRDQTSWEWPSTLGYNMKPLKVYTYCSNPGKASVELKQEHSIVAFGLVYSHAVKINGAMFITIIAFFILKIVQ